MISISTYTVRESTKTKGVRLEVSARHGLVVVVPKGFDQTGIQAVLEMRRAWIERALARVNEATSSLDPSAAQELPRRIPLQGIGEEWTLQYQPTEAPWVAVVERGGCTLLLHGNIDDTAACGGALRRWITRKAHGHLVPWLRQISAEQRLPFGKTVVKSQRTRWASCSSHKTISINQNLLFVPGRLVRYVLIHELCHTVHLNHSSKFWALVTKKEPAYLDLRKELRTAWRWIPAWIKHGRANAGLGDPEAG